MKQKPGVMIYFDMLPVLGLLSDAEKGILFQAILDYGISELRRPLPDKLELLWPLIQHRLDTDHERYNITVVKRKYAAYVRWEKQNQRQPMPYTKWVDSRGYETYDEQTADALALL